MGQARQGKAIGHAGIWEGVRGCMWNEKVVVQQWCSSGLGRVRRFIPLAQFSLLPLGGGGGGM